MYNDQESKKNGYDEPDKGSSNEVKEAFVPRHCSDNQVLLPMAKEQKCRSCSKAQKDVP